MERGALDHFWWSITGELATRAGMAWAAFEDEHERRVGQFASRVAGSGALN